MALNLMYITNQPEVAQIAERAGVDRIFVDLEYIGKAKRQREKNTVLSGHTVEDVSRIRTSIDTADLLVRVNPMHDASEDYGSSKEEIEAVLQAGADIVMLPFFKEVEEVRNFIEYVGGRAKTLLLFETPESIEKIDEILAIDGIDEALIGLNDLSIGYGKNFLFELLTDGTVERICNIFKEKGIPYGFGGIASIGKGMLPAEYIIKEHYRLGSSVVILSRSFCNTSLVADLDEIREVFTDGVKGIRDLEEECRLQRIDLEENRKQLKVIVDEITKKIKG